jgi:AhpD family alkylhydroperoxidase
VKDQKERKRIDDLKDAMRRERGYLYPEWEFLAENDVEFMEAYNNLYNRALRDGKALPGKTRELIAIALLAYRGLENAVYEHVKRALRLGATKQELLEAIDSCIIPGGAPTFSTGLRALMRVDEEKKAN